MGYRGLKFQKGMEVEVRSDEDGYRGAWFEGVIVSNVEDLYEVRYDHFLTEEGHSLIELMDASKIRLRPPKFEVPDWAVGDAIEVYENECWWEGVIKEVLPDRYYSIRFPLYAKNKTYHHSMMRAQLECKNGRWSRKMSLSFKESKRGHAFNKNVEVDEGFASEGQKSKTFLKDMDQIQTKCSKKADNPLGLHAVDVFTDASQMDFDKECFVSTTGSQTASALQVKRAYMAKNSTQHATKKLSRGKKNVERNEMDLTDSIQEFKLYAYLSVLKVFHARGLITWEQEILLTNLRLELNISSQEHRFVLDKLRSWGLEASEQLHIDSPSLPIG